MPDTSLGIVHKQAVSLKGLHPGETLEYVHQLTSVPNSTAIASKKYRSSLMGEYIYAEYNIHSYIRKPAATVNTDESFFFFFFNFFWLHWAFIAVLRLSLVVVSGAYSSLRCAGFSLRWLVAEHGF